MWGRVGGRDWRGRSCLSGVNPCSSSPPAQQPPPPPPLLTDGHSPGGLPLSDLARGLLIQCTLLHRDVIASRSVDMYTPHKVLHKHTHACAHTDILALWIVFFLRCVIRTPTRGMVCLDNITAASITTPDPHACFSYLFQPPPPVPPHTPRPLLLDLGSAQVCTPQPGSVCL